MAAVLPPGVTASATAGALEAFAGALGPDAVLTAEQDRRDALDPNGVLSPGKQGIRPRHLRRAAATPSR